MENTVDTVGNIIQIGRGPNNRIRLWKTEEMQQYREYHIVAAPVHIGDRLHAWWGWLTVTRLEIHQPAEWEYTSSSNDKYYVYATAYCEDTMGLPEVPYQICWRLDQDAPVFDDVTLFIGTTPYAQLKINPIDKEYLLSHYGFMISYKLGYDVPVFDDLKSFERWNDDQF